MNPVEKEKRMISDEELLEHFEVEELENRLEFAKWTAEMGGEVDGSGTRAYAKITCEWGN